MDKLIKFILFINILAFAETVYSYSNVGDDFLPYYNNYQKLLVQYCPDGRYNYPRKLSIQFDSLKEKVGECQYKHDSAIIRVDRSYWLDSTEDVRLELMYHEFAHCFLHVDHVDNADHYRNAVIQRINKEVILNQAIEDMELHCTR